MLGTGGGVASSIGFIGPGGRGNRFLVTFLGPGGRARMFEIIVGTTSGVSSAAFFSLSRAKLCHPVKQKRTIHKEYRHKF